MATKDIDQQYLSVKTLFESGKVKKMRDIEKLFPSKISKALGLNHSRYIEKLYKPDGFLIRQIVRLANLIDVNPKIISDIILDEVMLKNSNLVRVSKVKKDGK